MHKITTSPQDYEVAHESFHHVNPLNPVKVVTLSRVNHIQQLRQAKTRSMADGSRQTNVCDML